jgi:hypothetical protein
MSANDPAARSAGSVLIRSSVAAEVAASERFLRRRLAQAAARTHPPRCRRAVVPLDAGTHRGEGANPRPVIALRKPRLDPPKEGHLSFIICGRGVNLRKWNVAVRKARAANPRRCIRRTRPGWPRARGQSGPSHTEMLGNGSRPDGPRQLPGGHQQTTTERPQRQPWPSRTLPPAWPHGWPPQPGAQRGPGGMDAGRPTAVAATSRSDPESQPGSLTTSGSRPEQTRAHQGHPEASSRPGGTPEQPTRPPVPTRPSRPRTRSGRQQHVRPGGSQSACGAASLA